MQEEVENRTVAITTSAAKFTGRLFKAAICKYLEYRKNVKTQRQTRRAQVRLFRTENRRLSS